MQASWSLAWFLLPLPCTVSQYGPSPKKLLILFWSLGWRRHRQPFGVRFPWFWSHNFGSLLYSNVSCPWDFPFSLGNLLHTIKLIPKLWEWEAGIPVNGRERNSHSPLHHWFWMAPHLLNVVAEAAAVQTVALCNNHPVFWLSSEILVLCIQNIQSRSVGYFQ